MAKQGLKRRAKARNWDKLTHRQLVTLMIGRIVDEPDGFDDDDAKVAEAWQHWRERLMASCNLGHRPGGWWICEASEDRDLTVAEPEQLGRMGALSHAETTAMEREGRVLALAPFRKGTDA